MRTEDIRTVVRVDATSRRVAVTSSTSPVAMLVVRPMIDVRGSATIADAAASMAREDVSSLVVDGGAAIVTERDIARAVAAGVDAAVDPVASIATPHPVTVEASTPIVAAAAIMLNEHVRHLFVRADDGVTGVVSLRDVVAVLLQAADPELWLRSLRLTLGPPSEIWIG